MIWKCWSSGKTKNRALFSTTDCQPKVGGFPDLLWVWFIHTRTLPVSKTFIVSSLLFLFFCLFQVDNCHPTSSNTLFPFHPPTPFVFWLWNHFCECCSSHISARRLRQVTDKLWSPLMQTFKRACSSWNTAPSLLKCNSVGRPPLKCCLSYLTRISIYSKGYITPTVRRIIELFWNIRLHTSPVTMSFYQHLWALGTVWGWERTSSHTQLFGGYHDFQTHKAVCQCLHWKSLRRISSILKLVSPKKNERKGIWLKYIHYFP